MPKVQFQKKSTDKSDENGKLKKQADKTASKAITIKTNKDSFEQHQRANSIIKKVNDDFNQYMTSDRAKRKKNNASFCSPSKYNPGQSSISEDTELMYDDLKR